MCLEIITSHNYSQHEKSRQNLNKICQAWVAYRQLFKIIFIYLFVLKLKCSLKDHEQTVNQYGNIKLI